MGRYKRLMNSVTRDYPIVGLSHARSAKLVTIAEVPDLVPWIVCEGGPKDGWVYDTPPAVDERDRLDIPSVTYEYTGEIVGLPDGNVARCFAYVPDVEAG